MLDICKIGEEVLREKTSDVKTFDSAFSTLLDAMFETLAEADGVGLAAPQVGIPQRFFIVDLRKGDEGKFVFVNPEIIETSVEEVPYEEGCLSIPGIYREIVRPERVKVTAQDARGKRFTISASGLLARVIQHENDHLNGKLFVDYLPEDERAKIERRVMRIERKKRKRKA